jgi:alkaline phosphatase
MNTAIMRVAAIGLLTAATSVASATQAKNVILMISDGQGFNHVTAADMYTGSQAVYHSFDTKVSMTTYSANNNFATNPMGYDPTQMASNFNYVKSNYTDSASAASAMYCGEKIYDGEINMTTSGDPLTSFFEMAAKNPYNKSMGAVSSVQMTHATPGAVYGHNNDRGHYAEIGTEGIYGSNPNANNAFYDALNYNGNFTVLMGAGHGDYDNNGNYNPGVNDKYAGGTVTWEDVKDGAAPNGWTFVETKGDFEDIAAGNNVPNKLLGFAQVNSTLQQGRNGGAPMNANVPTLETMTKAALNVLSQNANGFTVMIEGGAVDWAGHANQTDRLVEEQVDFNNSVQAAVDWIDTNSSWEETLLIVTADHETGYLLGADGSNGYFDVNGNGQYDHGIDYGYLGDNNPGALPDASWHSGSHTNQLVPLFAKGAGSELFADYIIGNDPNLDAYYNLTGSGWTGFNGDYIDNTSIFSVMTGATDIPEPTSIALIGLAGSAILMRRRSA